MASNTLSDRSDERDLREFVLAGLAVEVFMVIFLDENKVYDLSTAAIFAFSLGFLARAKFGNFYALYPIGCLNRETMFLVTIFFAVHYFWKMRVAEYLLGLAYQWSVFVAIHLFVSKIFEGNAGQSFYFWPLRVTTDYLSSPVLLVVLILTVAAAVYFIKRQWTGKPAFLRSAVVIILPVLFVLHMAMGMAFEIRVFAEVYPVVWVLMVYRV